jgi:Limiting CO2-inducible proteins B/C beta carbonyic anhydrases
VQPYADAVDVETFLDRVEHELAPYGFTPTTALPLLSVCRDELMADFRRDVRRRWGHFFDLASLGGLPLLGRTGVAAALGHAPLDGVRHRLLVLALPHVGLEGSVVGSVVRPGVPGTTSACGAIVVAQQALAAGVSGVVLDRHDVEESLLVARLHETLGSGAVPDLVATTELVRRAAVDELRLLAGELSTPDAPVDVALVSGVLVHATGHDHVADVEVEVLARHGDARTP